MKTILEILRKIVIIIFIIISGYILYLNIKSIFEQNIHASFIYSIIVLVLIYLFTKLPEIKNKKLKIILKITGWTIFTLIVLYIAFKTRVNSTWDYDVILEEVHKYINGLDTKVYYFARYPNNIPLFIFQAFLGKLGYLYNPDITIIGIQSITIIVNTFIVIFSIYLLSLIAKKTIDNKTSKIVILLSILYCPLYLWATIMYTDTIGMILNLISLFMFYIYENTKNKKLKIISIILLGISIAFGFKFKATNIFILIALIIQLIYEKRIKLLITLPIITVISIVTLSSLINSIYPITEEQTDTYNFPYTHWIMMALNPKTDGGYITEDVVYSISFPTLEERKAGIMSKINERIDNYTTKELITRLFYTKVNRTWVKPAIGSEDYLTRNPKEWNFINNTVTWKGTNYQYYKKYIAGVYLLIILGMFISGFINIKNNNKYIFISQMLIIGMFLFELIWESHARYIYTFVPFMLLLASYSYIKIINKITKNKELNYEK